MRSLLFAFLIQHIPLICALCPNQYDQVKGTEQYSKQTYSVVESKLSLSFWFRYQPNFEFTHQYFPIQTSGKTYEISGQLLMTAFDPLAKLFRLLSFFDASSLTFKTVILNEEKNVLMQCQQEFEDFEGIWMYQQFFISQNQLIHIYYNYLTDYYQQDQTSITLENNKLEITLGGYGYFQDYRQNLYFDPFNGQLSSINYYIGDVDFTDSTNVRQNLKGCINTFLTCNSQSQILINDIGLFTGSNTTYITQSSFSIDNTFKLEGWFIIQNNINQNTFTLLELRNQDVSQYIIEKDGNLLFRIRYQILNGNVKLQFIVQSYQNNLYSDQQILELTQDLQYVEKWHYLTFIYDRENKVKSGIFTAFPSAPTPLYQLSYPNPVLFLSGDNLFITLGANIQFKQYFQGQLSKITINSCFDREDPGMKIQCHPTCLTCTGPNHDECKSCDANLFRVITTNTHCICMEGYLQFANQQICQSLIDLSFIELNEIESMNINCRYGEFLLNNNGQNSCIKCPQQNPDSILHCGDCLENQSTWQYNLQCTYDYELNDANYQESTYKKVIYDPELYLLDMNSQTIIECLGCQDICQDTDCYLYNYSNFGQEVYVRCKENFYYNNGQCSQCDLNCKICAQNFCSECINNYYYDPLLQSCINSILSSNTCGYQCKNCTLLNGQNRCITCYDNYKTSIDGINCELFEIENCLQEYNIQGSLSTIPYFFNIASLSNTKPICIYCNLNNYNMDNNICQDKSVPNCDYSITVSTTDICLIGNPNQVAQTTCSSNCQLCVKDSTNFINGYCVQCSIGYYLDPLFGTCTLCPSSLNCISCSLTLLKPNTQQLHPQLVFLFQQGLLYDYQQSLLLLHESFFQVQCIACNSLNIIDSYCYGQCPSYCQACDVVNQKLVCIKCKSTSQIIQSNENCLECPTNCLACAARSITEINSINSFFDLNNLHFIKYSHKCYKPSPTTQYLSTNFQTALKCKNFKNCQQVVHLNIDAYCLSQNYDTKLAASTKKDQFVIFSTMLDDLESHFETQYYNTDFLEELNDLMIQKITIAITLISSSGFGCSLNQLILNQKFQQYIFALEEVEIQIIGQSLIQLELPKTISFQNFTKVSFKNIIFYGLNQIQYSQITTTSYFKNFAFSIENCVYQSIQTFPFQFDIGAVQSFYLKGFTISNTKLFEKNLFNLDFSNTPTTVIIEDVKLLNSQLKDLVFISISNSLNLDCTIFLKNIEINSVFINSSFFNYTNQTELKGTLSIEKLSVSKSSFFGNYHFLASYASFNIFSEFNLTQCQFYNTSSFLFIHSLSMSQNTYQECLIENGYFLTNYGYGSLSSSNSIITMEIIKFQEISYYSSNQLMNFIYTNKIVIQDLIVSNNTPQSSNYSYYCVFLQGNSLSLSKLNVTKNIGNIDIYLDFTTIILEDSILQQSQEYNIIIQPSLYCLSSYYTNEQYTSILDINVIQSLIINNLQILNLNLINSYGIKIQGSFECKIIINNCIIKNNKILITQNSLHIGLIYYQSIYYTIFQLIQTQFIENTLYSYVIDKDAMLAVNLLIYNPNGYTNLNNNQFLQNIALNTTFTINYINSQILIISNSLFQQNNYNDLQLIYNKVSDSFSDQVSIEQIWNTYNIDSIGGNGQYYGQNITLFKNQFIQSTASQGGGIYIQTTESGVVNIFNCNFIDLKCSLEADSTSKGGALYIDASYASLNLQISDCVFKNVYSKISGGALYINPSNQLNNIQIQNGLLIDCIALLGSFIYAIFPTSNITTISIRSIDYQLSKEAINNYFTLLQGFSSEFQTSLKQYGALVALSGGTIKLQSFRVEQNHYFGIGAFRDYEALFVSDIEVFSTQSLFYNAFSLGASQTSVNGYTIIKQVLLDSINSNLIASITNCNTQMTFDMPSVLLQCQKNQIFRRGFTSSLTDQESNLDCNLNLLYTYSLNQGKSYMDVFHIVFLNSQKLSQLLSISSVIMLNSNVNQLDQIIDNQNAFLGDSRNQSFQLSHHLFVKNQFKSYLMLVGSAEENQRLLQGSTFTCNTFISNIISHLNIADQHPGGFLGNNKIVIDNFIVTNVTISQLKIFSFGVFQPIFISNMLITDCSLDPNKTYVIQFLAGQSSTEITKNNDVFAYNTIKGTSVQRTSFVTLNAERLGFSADGLTRFYSQEILRNDTTIIEQINVARYKPPGETEATPFLMLPSGQEASQYQYFDLVSEQYYSLNLNLSLFLLNRESQPLILQEGQEVNLSVSYRIMNQSKQSEPEFTSLLNISSTDGTNQIFINDMIIEFDPYSSEEMYYQLMFSTTYLYIPVYSDAYPYEEIAQISNYQLRLNVKTYKCQIGEFIYLNQCKKCDDSQNYYQVIRGQSFCYLKDDASMISVKPYTVQMRSGYWRYVFQSTIVEYCYHYPTNCLGGWKYGNPTCVAGHIGALCEQCDLYNIRGQGSYSVSSQYTCGSCQDTKYNIIIIVVIALFTLTMGIITVKSSIDDTEEFILRNKIKAFGIAPSVRILSTILIKMLTNYAQIISSVFTFQLQLPPQIQQSTVSVGNPTQSMVYSLDCFLISMSKLTIMYLEFIWMLATPFFFISIIYIIFFILIILKLKRFNIGIITTTLIYFYIYMQPNLIQNMISQLSKRTISDVQFVQGNVSYEFYTSTHMKWLGFVITPILIILGGVIPFSLWYQVFKNKLHLDDITVRLPWGFYYNEYKKQAYYWETVKLLQKQTIIIALNYYEDEVSIKASLVLLIVFIYHVLSDKINPYYVLQLNRLDTQSTVVCSISIILCSAIYQAQTQGAYEVVWPFYIISGLLNIWYILNLLIQIVFSYLAQYQELFDKIKNIITRRCSYFIDKYPYLKDLLTTKQQRQKRIRERFAKIREYLFRKAKRAVRARKLTMIQSPELYYQRRGGISSPCPLNQLDMIESQSHICSPMPRHSNQTIRLVETVYASRNQDVQPESNTRRDEFQIEDDNLSPQVVYISINPKLNTRSQLM